MTNGELAHRSYKNMEKKTGLPLADLAEGTRDLRTTFKDLQAQPRRLINSPMWSGLMRQRPTLRALHLQPREARSVADADRTPASLPRSPRLPRSSASTCRPTSRSRQPHEYATSGSARTRASP